MTTRMQAVQNASSSPDLADDIAAQAEPISYRVGMREKYGRELEGLEIFGDGLSFRCPLAMPGGRIVELVLCDGTILVDAEIVQCLPLADEEGSYAVRVRYHQTSDVLASLINEEIRHASRHSKRV